MSRREAARGRSAAETLGDRPDVVRACAAADAEIVDSESVRLPCEVLELVAVAHERIERCRERPVVRDDVAARVAERVEGGSASVVLTDGQKPRHDLTIARTFSSNGSIVLGPRAQFNPATSAPASSIACRRPPASTPRPSSRPGDRERDHRRQTGRLNRLEGKQRFLAEREGLTHDVVHVGVDRPRDLLLEHRPNRRSRVGVVDEHVRVADVAREQRAGLVGDVLRERECLPVQLLEQVLLVDHA